MTRRHSDDVDETVYSLEALMELLEDDEISAAEAAFMHGYNDEA